MFTVIPHESVCIHVPLVHDLWKLYYCFKILNHLHESSCYTNYKHNKHIFEREYSIRTETPNKRKIHIYFKFTFLFWELESYWNMHLWKEHVYHLLMLICSYIVRYFVFCWLRQHCLVLCWDGYTRHAHTHTRQTSILKSCKWKRREHACTVYTHTKQQMPK